MYKTRKLKQKQTPVHYFVNVTSKYPTNRLTTDGQTTTTRVFYTEEGDIILEIGEAENWRMSQWTGRDISCFTVRHSSLHITPWTAWTQRRRQRRAGEQGTNVSPVGLVRLSTRHDPQPAR